MKYLVKKTCYAGGRRCIEGQIVDLPKIDNKYLELVVDKKKKVTEKPKSNAGEGQPLSSLSQQPKNATTGMAAKRENIDKAKQEGK